MNFPRFAVCTGRLLLVFSLPFAVFLSCSDNILDEDEYYVKKGVPSALEISKSSMDLDVNADPVLLTVSVLPEKTKNQSVIWTSSDPSVATVDSTGLVTPVSTGNSTITVRSDSISGDTAKISCEVRIRANVSTFIKSAVSAARFYNPGAVALDSAGNVYVADTLNHTIRKITSAGVVTTFAGVAGYSGSVDGIGTAARFKSPEGIAVDSAGNVYVADASNHTIRKITPGGVVTTLAGLAGSADSDDGNGTVARFNYPTGIAVDSSGNVYVADTYNYTIRKITPAGTVSTLAGSASASYGSTDGIGAAARFYYPRGVAVNSAGKLYVADSSNHIIRTITPDGMTATFAGSGGSGSSDGVSLAHLFTSLVGCARDSSGNFYVIDSNSIKKIAVDGTVSVFAGSGTPGSSDGIGSAAKFFAPKKIVLDGSDNLYVTDSYNQTIRKITADGTVTTLAGSANFSGSSDGRGSAARFNNPYGLAIDSSGILYVADSSNNVIRKITSDGTVSTFAGSKGLSGFVDGNGTSARFYYPSGLTVDGTGNLYVADQNNHAIRKITASGTVSTLAGGYSSGSNDGSAEEARFNYPSAVALDSLGNAYVADTYNNRIRKIDTTGNVSTVAGSSEGFADGSGINAKFDNPGDLLVTETGTIYVVDTGNNAIRKFETRRGQ